MLVLLVIIAAVMRRGVSEIDVPTTKHAPSRTEIRTFYDDRLVITCDSAPLDVLPAPPELAANGPGLRNLTRVTLKGCGPPAPPDPPTFSHALAAHGLRTEVILRLELKEIPPSERFDARNFAGLDSIEYLTMQAAGNDRPQQLAYDFMRSLPNVKDLTLENEALPMLPENARIKSAILVGGRSLGEWGGCKHLNYLDLSDWRVSADGWLAQCEQLQYLRAERMEFDSLRSLLAFSRRSDLFNLMLPHNALTTQGLAAALQNSVIDQLIPSVPDRNSTNILWGKKRLSGIMTLDLSYNMLSDFKRTLSVLHSTLDLRDKLGDLRLDYNPLRDYCDDDPRVEGIAEPPQLPKVKMLSLAGTNTSRLCFSDWSTICSLNISNNNIEVLQFGQLPLIDNVSQLLVDLKQNPLRELHFEESDYNALKNKHKPTYGAVIEVYTDTLPLFDCDCHNGWLARALRERRLRLSGALCHNGGWLRDVPPIYLECDLLTCKPCRCHRQWANNTVIMHCEALGLQDLPELPENLGEMYLRGNNIHSIRVEDLYKTLTVLDVRGNNVSRVDEAAVAALFEVKERRVWLSGNPLACDCDNKPLFSALMANQLQVMDYENVTCSDGRLMQYLDLEQLCDDQRNTWQAIVGVSVLLGLVALVGSLYARFNQPLKVWLYARGWCLCYVREEELDTDREYDAFLSFAHGDHEFVAEKLLPRLEGECGYKVCVHYRDWMPGELISTQIMRSVALSRRTVIVLSAHFVGSVWGLLEFRAAYVSALAEGRVRLLVVVLDDAPPIDELPEELRLYLRTTTYLRWDDLWFWKKFLYAMPHGAARDINACDETRCRERRETGTPCGIELMLQ